MKKSFPKHKLEFGQVIPLVVLMMFAIIAMVALILDGGTIMSNRRTAQAAADAGALAGAKQLCLGNPSRAISDGKYYAELNGAATPVADPTISGGMIHVITSVTQPSFFAGIFGVSTLPAGASADAGCYGPAGKAVLPLSWICKGPNAGELPFDPNMDCEIQTLSWDNLLLPLVKGDVSSVEIDDLTYTLDSKYPHSITTPVVNAGVTEYLPPKEIYIVIDTDKVCIEDSHPPYPTGAIVCDLDGDGKKEIQTSGDRGWLYLTADTNNITKWITDVPPFTLRTHIWLSGKSGGDVNVFNKLISYNYVGERVLIPVYNTFCEGDPSVEGSPCMVEAHDPLYWDLEPAGGDIFDEMRSTNDNYHVITFDAFYISCVSTKGDCPGANYARSIDPDLGEIPTMEGFFLTDVGLSADYAQNCSVNLGNCIVSLSK